MKHFLVVCVFSLLKKSSFFVPSALIAHATNLHHQCCSPKYREASQFTINTILPFGWLLVFFCSRSTLFTTTIQLDAYSLHFVLIGLSLVFSPIFVKIFFFLSQQKQNEFSVDVEIIFFFERKKIPLLKIKLPLFLVDSLFGCLFRFFILCSH